MKDAVQDRFERLKRAAQVITGLLNDPPQTTIRRAESSGCLDEYEFLMSELMIFLDDDDYFDDVAWNMENESGDLYQAC